MKYEPLRRYLETAGAVEELGFADIERIIGAPLPPSARKHPAWWSNSPEGHVNARAWLEAGFKAEGLDLTAGKIAFRRTGLGNVPEGRIPGSFVERIRERLGGMVTIPPGVDLCEPLWEFVDDED